jgi:formyltetrahydrofolate deformylase
MKAQPVSLVALLHGPDQPGLVARAASWIFERRGNILHADQHRDAEANIFFQRLEWIPGESIEAEAEATAFNAFASGELGMRSQVRRNDHRARIALYVSRIDHCFHDVILRWKSGDFRGDIVCVVSNHPDLEEASRNYGLPFHHVPVTAGAKETAERKQAALCREHRVGLVLLARYMQVLSPTLIAELGCPIINIHHSFLPAFAGGRPYQQAHTRGVKLIGATAHYATAELDEGPIIHQDVCRVNHRHSVADLTRRGRDLERIVFAQAIRWHLDDRVLVYNRKTVVFD